MIFYDAGGIKSQFLKAVLDAKNIEYRTETVTSECAIGDKDLLLMEIFPAIKYLDERYPVPKLFAASPEQNARLSLFVLDVMLKAYETGNYDSVFKEINDLPFPHNFLLGDNLTIADLVLYPILPDTPTWNRYKAKIEEQLNNEQ